MDQLALEFEIAKCWIEFYHNYQLNKYIKIFSQLTNDGEHESAGMGWYDHVKFEHTFQKSVTEYYY